MFQDNSPLKANGPKAPLRGNKSKQGAGWSEESTIKDEPSNARESNVTVPVRQDSEDDILVIPEVEPGNEEIDRFLSDNLKSESLKRAAAYKELNSGTVSKQKMLQNLDGIDLRILTKNLLPESQLHEADIPWNWDVVFAEIVPDLQKDETAAK